MAEGAGRVELDLEGRGAPPRRNGELVFEAPWEGRLFGLTMALHGAGLFAWEEFRELLIEEIGLGEDPCKGAEASGGYYERWQRALERLLVRKGLCGSEEIGRREGRLASRPPGHDH